MAEKILIEKGSINGKEFLVITSKGETRRCPCPRRLGLVIYKDNESIAPLPGRPFRPFNISTIF